MGCLSAHITRKDALSASAVVVDGLHASTSRKGALTARGSLVCSVMSNEYLRVTPAEPQWITDWESIQYDILSNTEWIVTINS